MNEKVKFKPDELSMIVLLAKEPTSVMEAKKRIKQLRKCGFGEHIIKEYVYELSHNQIKGSKRIYHKLREDFRARLM